MTTRSLARERAYSDREWARWGRFASELPSGVTEVVCGCCGTRYTDPAAKAYHLEEAHGAVVRLVEGGSLFEWSRP